MRRLAAILLAMLAMLALAVPVGAEDAARLDPARSSISDAGGGIAITLALTAPVGFRTLILADPPRLVVDFREVDFTDTPPLSVSDSARIADLRWGRFRPGWSRMVAELTGPYRIETAAMDSRDAVLRLRLAPVEAARFAAVAGPASDANWDLPRPAEVAEPKRRQTGDAPLVVVLDPGHGGIDPGAEAGGTTEARLMLLFAHELVEVLRAGGMRPVLTRETDDFVPLETRISLARAAGGDLMLSLHADALEEGRAVGATIYKLSAEASDEAAALLAERHDRADLLAGVDLSEQDDELALVLMDMARIETEPRADRLAEALAAAITAAGGGMHRHPIQSGAFSVLKAPDIPSLLLELGFLSSPADLERLKDPKWRATMQGAIAAGLRDWALADAAEAKLIRQ